METESSTSVHEVRTRGEHSKCTVPRSDVAMSDVSRNSVVAPPMKGEHLHIYKLGVEAKRHTGSLWDECPTRDGNDESHMTGPGNIVTVLNKSVHADYNVGGNTDNNPCWSPLPKKLKLSLKRTSPKEKGTLAMKRSIMIYRLMMQKI